MTKDDSSPAAKDGSLVDFLENGEELRCLFLTRMDTAASAAVDKVLMEKYAVLGEKKVVFDLEKVDYVASAFLRLCVLASKKSGGRFAITNVAPTVRKVLKIAGFESIAEIS